MSQQGMPPFRQYGDPPPAAPGKPIAGGRGRTVLMSVAAVLIGVILGLLLGFWYRDRDEVPVPTAPSTTTTTTQPPPGRSVPTTRAPVVTTVPRTGPTTTTGGSGTTVAELPIPPDTANPLAAPTGIPAGAPVLRRSGGEPARLEHTLSAQPHCWPG